ncbi:hypothetical protein OPV22_030403 [Ensete ventricosum]|uniref:Uncharacterized protein n=1 Tax=Ensete ventricosum TaxID=4639 RepID=A0AAV8P713_ENSVE|nr:hypothetical protein OPV22_030403 [Ensete ventricosum]
MSIVVTVFPSFFLFSKVTEMGGVSVVAVIEPKWYSSLSSALAVLLNFVLRHHRRSILGEVGLGLQAHDMVLQPSVSLWRVGLGARL